MKDVNCRAIAGSAYNPNGNAEYKPQYMPQFLELGADHVIASGFWDLVGENGTYGEMLEIAKEAGASSSNMEDLFFTA